MSLRLALAIASAILISTPAFSAKEPANKSDAEFDAIVHQVVKDRYFPQGECQKYIGALALPEQDSMVKVGRAFQVNDMLTFARSGKSVIGDYEGFLEAAGYKLDVNLVRAKNKLKNKPNLKLVFKDEIYSEEALQSAVSTRDAIFSNYPKGDIQRKNLNLYLFCRVVGIGTDLGIYAKTLSNYVSLVETRTQQAKIGYFEVVAEKGQFGKTVATGNKFAEPKQWEGSRFFIVFASFKNADTESRLPVEGSLFINYNGKDYEFDSVEPIALEGYNIWFRKINPLITMKTKIVYRIPDEIHGEVFWRPGGNPDDTKLWLGFVPASK